MSLLSPPPMHPSRSSSSAYSSPCPSPSSSYSHVSSSRTSSTYLYDVPAFTYTPQPSPRSTTSELPKSIELPDAFVRRRVDSSLARSTLLEPHTSYHSIDVPFEEIPRKRMNRERRGRTHVRAVGGRRARSGSESTDESPGPFTPPMHEHTLAALAPRITINDVEDNVQHVEEVLIGPFADNDSPIHRATPFLDIVDCRPLNGKRRSPRYSPIVFEPTIVEDDIDQYPPCTSSENIGLGLDLGTTDDDDLCTAPLSPVQRPSSPSPSITKNDKRKPFRNMRHAIRARWAAFKLRVRISAFRTRRRVGLV